MPRDWALRPSYDTRVAIINAMYACGENVQKLMPVLLTEAVRRDRQALLFALCHPHRIPLSGVLFPTHRSDVQSLCSVCC